MEARHKGFYEAPSTMIFEVKQGGVICTSDIKSGNSINGWGNDGTINDDVYM